MGLLSGLSMSLCHPWWATTPPRWENDDFRLGGENANLVRQHELEKFERCIEYLANLGGAKNVFMVGGCESTFAYKRTFFEISKSAKNDQNLQKGFFFENF